MSQETLALLRNIVATLRLDVTAPDFLQTAQAVAKALAELDEELASAPSPTAP